MDETDVLILRELYADRVLRLGGADPRTSAATIGERLGLATSTVTRRLREWKRNGILRGYFVFPNPALLGRRIYGQELEATSSSALEGVFATLPLLDRAFHVWHGQTGPACTVGYLDVGPGSAERGAALLGRLPGVRILHESFLFPMPAPKVEPTPLDWRLVAALRADPGATLTGLADRVGITLPTARRRFDRLLDGHALFYTPQLDFSRATGSFAEFDVRERPGEDLEAIWAHLRRLFPSLLPHAQWEEPSLAWSLRPDLGGLGFFLALRTPAEAHPAAQRIEAVPGVDRVTVSFPVRTWNLGLPFDEAIAEHLARAPHRTARRRSAS